MPGESDLILRDMSDGVVVIDAKGRLKTINPAARALLELGGGALSESFAGLFIGDSRNDGFVQTMLDALLVLSVFIRKKTSLHPPIVFRGEAARKAVWAGVLVTACAIAAMIAVKFALRKAGSPLFKPDAPFFDFSRFTAKEIYRYLPCVLAQEFVARSIMQEGFIYVFGERYGGLPILVSSLVFGLVHLPYSFAMMVGATVLLGALGVFYQKNRNLIAVTIVHYFATEAAMILGML